MLQVSSLQLEAWLAMLVFPMARVLGVVMTAPVFGNRGMPMRIRLMVGLGITLVCMQHAYAYLESGALVRVLPDWYVDAGNTSLYYAANKLLPAKTRVFVDFVVDYFRRQDLARRFSAFPTG